MRNFMKIRNVLVVFLTLALSSACGGDDAPKSTTNNTTPEPDATQNGSDMGEVDGGDEQPDARFVGVMNCEADADCDDGRSCTTGACVDRPGEGKVCEWSVNEGTCLVDSVCYGDGDASPTDPCGVCDPAQSNSSWSAANDGTTCDDGNVCTVNTVCTAGSCEGEAVDCNDGNSCTEDSCSPVDGCVNIPVEDGTTCDDGTMCTENDVCTAGECAGETLDCDDGNECTDETCDPASGCMYTNNTNSCDDGDPCTVDEVCDSGTCGGGQPNTCDDFNACTIDVCDPIAGCQHLPTNNPCCSGMTSICDDGDPCTTDLCDPQTAECSYDLNTAPCDDGNVCTENDTCDGAGSCTGTTRSCDDGNSCTADMCNVTQGCFYAPLDQVACDDGLSCSTNDTCNMGVCEADTSQCLCVPTFTDASKATSVQIGPDEMAGNALDIDGDTTLDNALAPLASIVNPELDGAVTSGDLNLLFEYIGFAPGSFTLALLTASLDPANSTCDFQNATCNYLADRSALDPTTCEPLISIPANRTGSSISGGGMSTVVPLAIPLGTSTLNLTVYMVRIEKTVSLDATTGEVTGFSGVLGGAVTESELNAAILAVDPASLPLPPMNIISLLQSLAPNDIDTNGDGTLDAKSIGLVLSGIDGNITGTSP